ncbi:MAG TPA: hypothetical protein VK929_09655 [Longimicrobiales bacterium]|nr:hypothetical protein [Longimicrobiales bacterium]
MTPDSRGSRRRLWLAALPLSATLLAGLPVESWGQVPPVPPVRDTIRADTLVADTLPLEEPQSGMDTVPARPVVPYPLMPAGPAAGFAAGEWVWDRDALLREAPTSLADLLDRIPGVTTFRAGTFVQPEAAAAFGGTATRTEIEVDGYILDPVDAGTFDLAQLPLAHIREVRVQRRLGLLRIRILTDYATEPEPYTRVEAGIGQPAANMFRGVVLAPHVLFGPFALAVERLDTDGAGRREPSSLFSGWAKWAWTDGVRGLQLDFMQATLEREPESPWPLHRTRRDMVVRARNAFSPGLVAEVYAGRTTVADSLFPPPGDTISPRLDDTGITQLGARLAFSTGLATIRGSVRYRDAASLPRVEAGVEADVQFGVARAGGEFVHATWDGTGATSYFAAHGELGLLPGTSIFAELTGGSRAAPHWRADERRIATERNGWRAGASAALFNGRATAGAAAFGVSQDMSWPFGLPFDSAGYPMAVGDGRGLEAFGRLVVVPGWLALESSIVEWTDAPGWAYTPARSWRTALETHLVPLPSGNLEILGRMEAGLRGAVGGFPSIATADDDEPPPAPVVPSAWRVNGYLHIRVIDVRMFLRWEDLLGNRYEVLDLPGRPLRGPRIFYGVKWVLWN